MDDIKTCSKCKTDCLKTFFHKNKNKKTVYNQFVNFV